MACHYNCPVDNFVFLVHNVLQRDHIGMEYIRRFLFCSSTCKQNFKKDFTTVDENGYEYYNKVESCHYNYCPMMMMDDVDAYKQKHNSNYKKREGLIVELVKADANEQQQTIEQQNVQI